ncbi:hypothetical protein Hypma_011836 [Hypsizygus marmoreus]|uniref:Uncharacterized protein n=1 Tax=Hypsizygus marmoreus TaxID=39966 RepID=A0A369JG18_HYPMA|nr:hypothetical protein Hypma_011836 [Hypsizygus marmoreus]
MAPRVPEEEEESGSDLEPPRHVFVDENGSPICFFIHESVRDQFAIQKLTADIERYGGRVLDDVIAGVDTVLVDDAVVKREAVQDGYDCHRRTSRLNLWVEPISFIRHCIRDGQVRHRVPPKKGMGGAVGRTRTEYTEKDVSRLCRYLAMKIPDARAGGRTGNGVYKKLEEMGKNMPKHHAWARRHTWQSWRNHYKHNAHILDPIIAEYAKLYPPTEKQKYHRDRRMGQKRLRYTELDSELSEQEAEGPELLEGPDQLGNEGDDRLTRGKRSHQRSERDSLDSARPTKRQRTRRREKEKGKERGWGSDYELEHNSLFSDIDEASAPGPSQARFATPEINIPPLPPGPLVTGDEMEQPGPLEEHLPSPKRTTAERPIPQTSPPPFTTQPTASQIPHQPAPRPSNATASGPPAFLTVSPAYAEASTSGRKANDNVLPSTPLSRRSDTSRAVVPPMSSGSVVPPSDEVTAVETLAVPADLLPPRPVARKQARRPAELNPTQSLALVEPPYRNTRSRSRSVEPAALPPQPSKGKRRQLADVSVPLEPLEDVGERAYYNTRSRSRSVEPTTFPPQPSKKAKGKRRQLVEPPISLEPVEEQIVEESAEFFVAQGPGGMAISGASNIEDEKDVEDLLVVDVSDISGVSHVPDDAQDSSDENSTQSGNESPDTDDREIDRTLRRGPVIDDSLSQRPTSMFTLLGPDPEEMLKNFQASLMATSLSSRRSSARPAVPSKMNAGLTIRPRHSAPLAARKVSATAQAPSPPRTPVYPRLSGRQSSTSSVDSFPIPGTKASAVKRRIEEEEKRAPYKPPVGTRAALVR